MYVIFPFAKRAFFTETFNMYRVTTLEEVHTLISEIKKNHGQNKNWEFVVVTPENGKIVYH